MLANKYILIGLSALTAIIAWASTFDWISATNAKTGTAIIGVIAVAKVVLNSFAPAPGQPVTPTGNTLITHS